MRLISYAEFNLPPEEPQVPILDLGLRAVLLLVGMGWIYVPTLTAERFEPPRLMLIRALVLSDAPETRFEVD